MPFPIPMEQCGSILNACRQLLALVDVLDLLAGGHPGWLRPGLTAPPPPPPPTRGLLRVAGNVATAPLRCGSSPADPAARQTQHSRRDATPLPARLAGPEMRRAPESTLMCVPRVEVRVARCHAAEVGCHTGAG